jgi:hypothetical protein
MASTKAMAVSNGSSGGSPPLTQIPNSPILRNLYSGSHIWVEVGFKQCGQDYIKWRNYDPWLDACFGRTSHW